MRQSNHTLSVIAALAITVPATGGQGPTSELYVTASDQGMIHVIQGESVVRSWTTLGSNIEAPIVVLDDVRTLAGWRPHHGARYSLDGVDLGSRYNFPGGIGSSWDAATDGTNIYVADYSSRGVWKLDMDWSNGVELFHTPFNMLAITYDPTDKTLWMADFSKSRIEHRDLVGNIIGGFDTKLERPTCLALDPADGTLWFGSQLQKGTFWQYSRTGKMLQTVNYPALVDQNTLGGEFAFIPDACVYTIAHSVARRGCDACPQRGDELRSQAKCASVRDCDAKVKTTLPCPDGGEGSCRIKGKRPGCR